MSYIVDFLQLHPRAQNHCFVIADSQLMKGLSAAEKVIRSLVGQKSVKTCAYMSQIICWSISQPLPQSTT